MLLWQIQRSINITSGDLESLDDKFERIMHDIDEHNKKSLQQIDKNQLDVPIDSPTLRRYLLKKFGDISDFKPQFGSVNDNYIIDQLNSMGIKTIADFERIIPNNFKERYSEIQRSKFGTYATGLVIWILIIHDYKRYFKEAYKDSYGIFNSHDVLVFEKFGLDISKFPKRVKFDCAGL